MGELEEFLEWYASRASKPRVVERVVYVHIPQRQDASRCILSSALEYMCGLCSHVGQAAYQAIPWYLRPVRKVEYKPSTEELLREIRKPLNIDLAAHKRAAQEINDMMKRAGLA